MNGGDATGDDRGAPAHGGRHSSGADPRRDAALTLLVLAVAGAAAVAVSAPVTPGVVAAGVAAALVAELLLSLRAARVRAVWADRRVRVAAVGAALGGAALLTAVAGPWVLTALVAACCGYLAVLCGSLLWRRRDNA
jgi:hypothetical protein